MASSAEKEKLEKSPVAATILHCLVAQGRKWISRNEAGTGYKLTAMDIHLLDVNQVTELIMKEMNPEKMEKEMDRYALAPDEDSLRRGYAVYTKDVTHL